MCGPSPAHHRLTALNLDLGALHPGRMNEHGRME